MRSTPRHDRCAGGRAPSSDHALRDHHPRSAPEERVSDAALRPSRLDEFVGQAKVKESLQIAIDAAKQRQEPLDHALFFGPPGLGKTTLAMLMARELGSTSASRPALLERPGDLVGMLTALKPGDILFIDEVHRLRPALEEFLYPAMEESVTCASPTGRTRRRSRCGWSASADRRDDAGRPAHAARCARASAWSSGSPTTRPMISRRSSPARRGSSRQADAAGVAEIRRAAAARRGSRTGS